MRREIWKQAVGFKGYEVSNLGRVRSYLRNSNKPQILSAKEQIGLRKNGVTHVTRTCYIIARAFIGPRPKGKWVRHLNDKRSDNREINLAYGSAQDNSNDAKRNGIKIGRPPSGKYPVGVTHAERKILRRLMKHGGTLQ